MRLLSLIVSVMLAGAGLFFVAQPAAALNSSVTVTSSASGAQAGDSTKATVTVAVDIPDQPVSTVKLVSSAPGRVDADSVRIDGSNPLPGTVDVDQRADTGTITIRAGVGATPAFGGIFSVGKHTIAYTSDLAGHQATIGTKAVAHSTFTYVDNGTTVATDVDTDATIPLPDLSIAASKYGAGANGLAVSPGGEYFFLAEVRNRGPKVQASTLTITLPDGLQVSSDEGVVRFDDKSDDEADVSCTKASATELRCPFGAVDGVVEVALDLEASTTAKPGTRGTLALHIEADNGLDATPADNTTSTAVRVVPPTRLRTSLTADDSSVEVGSKGRLTATVTNEGTEPVSVLGVVAVGNNLDDESDSKKKEHFEITAFTGRQGLPDVGKGDDGGDGGVIVPAAGAMPALVALGGSAGDFKAMARQVSSADDDELDDDPNVRLWNIGTLAPGATIKAVATVRAKSVGRSDAIALASGTASPSSCVLKAGSEAAVLRCPEVDTVKLRAVAGAGTNGNGTGTLAATGVPTTQLTVLGLALLLLGGLSLYAGSPRSRVIGRHRT